MAIKYILSLIGRGRVSRGHGGRELLSTIFRLCNSRNIFGIWILALGFCCLISACSPSIDKPFGAKSALFKDALSSYEDLPDAVSLQSPIDVTDTSAKIQWSVCSDTRFSFYSLIVSVSENDTYVTSKIISDTVQIVWQKSAGSVRYDIYDSKDTVRKFIDLSSKTNYYMRTYVNVKTANSEGRIGSEQSLLTTK